MTEAVIICAAAAALALIISVIKRVEAGIGGILSVLLSVWLVFIVVQGVIYIKNGLQIPENNGISEYLPYIFKSAGIGFIAHTAADICKDSGEASAGSKILTAGKLGILTVCLPLIKGILNTALGYING